jgi:hypothetical protein
MLYSHRKKRPDGPAPDGGQVRSASTDRLAQDVAREQHGPMG